MRKYTLTNDKITLDGVVLYRIRALRDFGSVKAGELGGFIQSETNLSHFDNCWVYHDACVYENASVSVNACVYDYARINGDTQVFGNVEISGYSKISGGVFRDSAQILGGEISGGEIGGNAVISGNAVIFGNPLIEGDAEIRGTARIGERAVVRRGVFEDDSPIVEGVY